VNRKYEAKQPNKRCYSFPKTAGLAEKKLVEEGDGK
jgi:hypothetical protein